MSDNRQNYLNIIEKNVRALHAKRFHRLWTVPTRQGEWCGRYKITQNFALQFAVLNHFRPDSKYLEHAKQHLLDLDRGYHFTAVFFGKTYEMLKAELSNSEREYIGKRWTEDVTIDLAKKVGSPADVKHMSSVSNHALCACVYADYTRKLFPKHSRPYQFEATTDNVWDIWWSQREFLEQASNYEGFAECFHCFWAELRKVKKEFYQTASIRNMFDRNERVVSPAGIVPPYGDSGHNEHATAWIALFEKVAADTRNSQFKQTAAQIVSLLESLDFEKTYKVMDDAVRKNIYNGRVLFAQHLHMISWLAMAALWTNPQLQEKPRPNPGGPITRLPLNYKLKPAEKSKLPQSKTQPHQVTLVGGPTDPAKQTFMLLSTGPRLIHDHADAGSILMLSRGNCCLLGTNGYLQRELPYHNTFYAQKAPASQFPQNQPIVPGNDDCRANIDQLQINKHDSYCRISFNQYHGLPLSLIREIFLSSNGNVTLIDRATAHKKGIAAGQLFHTEHIKKIAQQTYRCRINMMRSMCGVELTNAPGHLEIEFSYPQADIGVTQLPLPEIYHNPAYADFPCCHYVNVWQRSYTSKKCLYTKQQLRPGQEELFMTRLITTNETISD